MGKLANTLFMAAVVVLFVQGCKSAHTQSEPVMFPQVQVPSYINDQQQAVNYLARNFWDKFFTQNIHLFNGAGNNPQVAPGVIHGVDSLSFGEAFGAYARLLKMADNKSVSESLTELFANLDSLALTGERKPLLTVMELMEQYFYNPNSPVLDEEMYLRVLDGILAAKSLSDVDKIQYEYQHRICSLNRAGTPVADFAFEQMSGKKGSLYGIKGDYTLIFFNNPGCNACGEILEAIENSPVKGMVSDGKVKVLAMYIDEDLKAWRENYEKFPKEWIYAYDHNIILRDNNLYGLRAIPSLYLLDKEKRVILKDAPVGNIVNYLCK